MERPKHYGKWGQRGKFAPERVPKGHCRWCGDPITAKRRTSYCSAECSDEMALRILWGFIRGRIMERDKTCRLCDGHSYKALPYYRYEDYKWKYTPIELDWHVDHIKPVAEGGTDDPANLRLLCGKCHKRITKEWHGERAAARKPQQKLFG